MRRVIILGASAPRVEGRDLRIDCLPWTNVGKGFNLLDYDTLIVNLLSIENPEQIDWEAFDKSLHREVFLQFLLATPERGSAAVLGNPRFTYRSRGLSGGAPIEGDVDFLHWMPFRFEWVDGKGTGKRPSAALERMPEKFASYVHSIGSWDYALRAVDADINNVPKRRSSYDAGYSVELTSYCDAWAGSALVFRVWLGVYEEYSSYANITLGPIWFLPNGNVTELETIEAALAVLDVEVETPVPGWAEALTAPGEREILAEQEQLAAQIAPLWQAHQDAEVRRGEARKFLGLLYEKQRPLEPLVRDALRALGADVEDPERSDKEEGWLKVETDSGDAHGVLEVKSTRKETFDEQGLKQLEEWKLDGETKRGVEAKGIFIGNSAIEVEPSQRPWPFDKGWSKAAAKRGTVALTTTMLYMALALDSAGKLDRKEFWASVFETDGAFRGIDLAAAYESEFADDPKLLTR